MNRFTAFESTLQSIQSQLREHERIILSQSDIGLYNGKEKSLLHANGSLHLSNFRLIYIDAARPLVNSIALPLSLIRQTEYWIGLFASSPKITLLLGESGQPILTTTSSTPIELPEREETTVTTSKWLCRVCGMSNEVTGTTKNKCSLCGVIRSTTSTKPITRPLSIASSSSAALTSLPPSRTATPSPLPISEVTPSEIIPTSSSPAIDKRIPCPSCTFLNHPSLRTCEVCDSALGSSSLPRTRPQLSSSSSSTTTSTKDEDVIAPFVRLSFRKGGEKAFYAALRKALVEKEWDQDYDSGKKVTLAQNRRAGGGIDAILKGIDADVTQRGDEMEDALQDLNALMKKAKEMISIAQSINERLSQQDSTTSSNSSETTLVRTSLLNLGLPTPAITPDMVKESEQYHEALAKELGEVLSRKGSVMEKGIVGLDEIWCVWNRARGVALVSPNDLVLASPYLPRYTTPPLRLKTFIKSSLPVLHTPYYSVPAFTARLLSFLDLRQALAASFLTSFEVEKPSAEREGVTTTEVTREETGLSISVVEDLLFEVEQVGEVVRDAKGGEGVRWYRNYIRAFEWKDENVYT